MCPNKKIVIVNLPEQSVPLNQFSHIQFPSLPKVPWPLHGAIKWLKNIKNEDVFFVSIAFIH